MLHGSQSVYVSAWQEEEQVKNPLGQTVQERRDCSYLEALQGGELGADRDGGKDRKKLVQSDRDKAPSPTPVK